MLVPCQLPHTCPHCKAVNMLAIPPDAPVSARVNYNCLNCRRCFAFIAGSDSPATLFLVRCSCALAAFPGLLAVLWFGALLYTLWWVFHVFGAAVLAVLLVGCGVLLSLGHEGLKAFPLALWLLVPVVPLTRFVLLYLLHRPGEIHAITALMLLLVGGGAWFGAPAVVWIPQEIYDPYLLNPGKSPDEVRDEDLRGVGL